VARAYGVRPVTLTKWKRDFPEHGAEVFEGKNGDAPRVTGIGKRSSERSEGIQPRAPLLTAWVSIAHGVSYK